MTILNPCPFCGREAILESNKLRYGTIYSAYCQKCGAEIARFSEYEAISAWNHRTQLEGKPLTQDELREMDGEPVYIDDWFQDFHGWELSAVAEDYFDERDVAQYGSQWVAYRYKPECKYNINY